MNVFTASEAANPGVAASILAKAATFPQTRAAVSHAWRSRLGRVAIWWLVAFLTTGPYALLRARADNLSLPVHGAELDTAIFGQLPSLWLQHHLLFLWPEGMQWASVVIHASWFFVPGCCAIFVSLRSPYRIGSFFRWWIGLQLIGLALFGLVPVEPPWMATPDVVRLIAIHPGGEIPDANPLAAMPSLHVAVPLLISLWFFREHWRLPAWAMLAYTLLISFVAVFSGEHYVADVLGAVVVASAIALAARFDYRSILVRTRSRAREAFTGGGGQVAEPALASRARPHHRERAQTLLEFALLAPLILVFLFSIVDFGIAIDRRITLQHAVREGARQGAVTNDQSAIVDTTVDQSQGLLDSTNVSQCPLVNSGRVCVCYEDANSDGVVGDTGDNVKVSAKFTYDYTVPFDELFGAFGISIPPIEMTPSADMRLENAYFGAPPC